MAPAWSLVVYLKNYGSKSLICSKVEEPLPRFFKHLSGAEIAQTSIYFVVDENIMLRSKYSIVLMRMGPGKLPLTGFKSPWTISWGLCDCKYARPFATSVTLDEVSLPISCVGLRMFRTHKLEPELVIRRVACYVVHYCPMLTVGRNEGNGRT